MRTVALVALHAFVVSRADWLSDLLKPEEPAKDTKDRLDSSNVGYKLLQKAGWQEGKGLGKREHGREDPVEAFQNAGRQGLGFKKQVDPVEDIIRSMFKLSLPPSQDSDASKVDTELPFSQKKWPAINRKNDDGTTVFNSADGTQMRIQYEGEMMPRSDAGIKAELAEQRQEHSNHDGYRNKYVWKREVTPIVSGAPRFAVAPDLAQTFPEGIHVAAPVGFLAGSLFFCTLAVLRLRHGAPSSGRSTEEPLLLAP
jgi:hypothetical protein